MSKKITILGSTGSIGKNTIEVIKNDRDKFEIVALTARSDLKTLAAQANEFLRLVQHQNRNTGRPVVIHYACETSMAQMGDSILNGASEFMMVPFDLDLLRFKLTQSGVLLAAAA